MANPRFNPELVERAKKGEKAAMEQVLSSLRPLLKSFFTRKARDAFTVDDLVQNTLLRVHTGLKALRNVEGFKAFAMKAAIFELHDMYRGRYAAKERLFDPERTVEWPSPASSDISGNRLDVERALSVLTPHARRIIELKEYGYRYKEIAQTLGTTDAAVKMQVKRAFVKMSMALQS